MLITLKTLQQQTFVIEFELSSTVRELKEAIEEKKGQDFKAENMKLIYAGKILADTDPLSMYGIDEKKFIVVMVTKPKISSEPSPSYEIPSTSTDSVATQKPTQSEEQAVVNTSDVANEQAANDQPIPAPIVAAVQALLNRATGAGDGEQSSDNTPTEKGDAPTSCARKETTSEGQNDDGSQGKSTQQSESTSTAGSVSQAPPPQPSTGPEVAESDVPRSESELFFETGFEENVATIMDMGYDRPQVEVALRASYNNLERAVEYIIHGIPQNVEEELVQAAPAEQPSDEQSDDPLAFLRAQPQFQQMRQVIRQNPQLLSAVFQQIGQTNPALLQLISQNQEAFVRMLNEPSTGSAVTPSTQQPSQGAHGGEGLFSPTPIQLTQQDREAIERLKALGFPEHLVIQAYFACEKNENLAANFLLSQPADD